MPEPRGPSELNLVQLLPNLMTIAAMCSGLTGIRFATTGQFGAAVAMILVAALLDGLDGRVARLCAANPRSGQSWTRWWISSTLAWRRG